MTPRRYTVEEANAALSEVVPLLESLRDAQEIMAARQDEVLRAATTNGGGSAGSEFMEASRTAGRSVEALEEMGIIVRDPSSGLIDFPSLREGKEVLLCWRLGEGDIAWWHPATSGFADRRPL